MEQLGSYWTDFHEIWYVSIFRKPVEKIQVSLTSDKNNGYFTWTVMYNSHAVILRMRRVSEKPRREFKIHSLCSITLFRKSRRLWDNAEQYGTARQATDCIIVTCVPFAWWVTKATVTHSECVILIAFPLQLWLRERTSILRYTYIACLVIVHSLLANSTIMSQIRNTASFNIPSIRFNNCPSFVL